MNGSIKLLSFFLAFVMIFTIILSACGAEEELESDSESLVDESAYDTADGNVDFPILKDGQYIVKAVMPDSATSAEKAVYAKLRTALGNKTKVKVESHTDYLKNGESHDKNEYVILVGETSYNESALIYKKTKSNSYGIQILNKTRMVLYFSTEAEGNKLVNALMSVISTDDNGYFWVKGDYTIEKKTNLKLEATPSYPTSTTKVDCGDSTTMLYAKGTNLSSYEKYCSTLKSSGYTEYSKRDNVNGNYYRIYVKNMTAINVYFTKNNSTVRIITGPIDDIPSNDVDKTPEKNKKVTLRLISQGEENNCGLGLLMHLPNGKFIIFDGGFPRYDKLYGLLNEISTNGEKIVIAGWFISHPHGDHQDAVTNFIKKHAHSVDVENIFYNYAPSSVYEGTTQEKNSGGLKGVTDDLNNGISSNFSRTTKVIKPHTGQIYKFGSVSAEILYTVEDILPSKLDYVNSSSLVVRFTIAGQTILALADATHTVSTILQNTYGSYLKSDIVQLAHHGIYPGHASLYTKINAPVLLWPSNTENAKEQYSNDAVREALAKAKDVYLSKDTDVVLTLPYTPKNNKKDFLKSIGK